MESKDFALRNPEQWRYNKGKLADGLFLKKRGTRYGN